jgi:hypothetical protein
MGVDSCGSNTWQKFERSDQKLFNCPGVENALIAYTSSFRMGQILMYAEGLFEELAVLKDEVDHKYMVTTFIPKVQEAFKKGGFGKESDGERTGGCFLVAYRDKLFTIEGDYQVGVNSIGYAADGCGMEFALGSLHTTESLKPPGRKRGMPARDRILCALRAAAKFSTGVDAPFHVANTGNCKLETFEE